MSKKTTSKKDSIFQAMINYLEGRFSQLPDQRVGDNKFIAMKDIGLSAFCFICILPLGMLFWSAWYRHVKLRYVTVVEQDKQNTC